MTQYYEQIASSVTPPSNGPGDMPAAQSMEDSRTRDKLKEFRQSSATTAVIGEGKDAKWTFVQGNGIDGPSDAFRVNVVMTNADNPKKKFNLMMLRVLRRSAVDKSVAATWQIDTLSILK